MEAVEQNRRTAQAVGRSYGALFFSGFGACWLLLSAYAFGAMRPLQIVVIVAGVVVLAGTAFRIQRLARKGTFDTPPDEQRKRDDRAFGIVNALQWVAVFLIFALFPKIGLNDLAFPAVLAIVGLHFFAMPPSYRHASSFVTGAVLVAWAILCPLLFKGDRMIAVVALGAGLTLWASAAWALAWAKKQLRFVHFNVDKSR